MTRCAGTGNCPPLYTLQPTRSRREGRGRCKNPWNHPHPVNDGKSKEQVHFAASRSVLSGRCSPGADVCRLGRAPPSGGGAAALHCSAWLFLQGEGIFAVCSREQGAFDSGGACIFLTLISLESAFANSLESTLHLKASGPGCLPLLTCGEAAFAVAHPSSKMAPGQTYQGPSPTAQKKLRGHRQPRSSQL